MSKVLIVGAGITGLSAARILAEANNQVYIMDGRDHIGGNCYSKTIENIETHVYGPHVFHTSNQEVWDFLSRFTKWIQVEQHNYALYKDKIYSLPVNLETINKIYNKEMTPSEAKIQIENDSKEENLDLSTFEGKAISLIGRKLYEAFFKGYTKKNWMKDPKKMPGDALSRLPIRFNYDNDYFKDIWSAVPENYNTLFENIINHPNIYITLKSKLDKIKRNKINFYDYVIYTGEVDYLMDYKFGKLEYIGRKFENKVYDIDDFQGCTSLYCGEDKYDYIRRIEYKHFKKDYRWASPDTTDKTVVQYEYVKPIESDNEIKYYTLNDDKNLNLYKKYEEAIKEKYPNLFLAGRLGTYRYLDMDKACLNGIETAKKIINLQK